MYRCAYWVVWAQSPLCAVLVYISFVVLSDYFCIHMWQGWSQIDIAHHVALFHNTSLLSLLPVACVIGALLLGHGLWQSLDPSIPCICLWSKSLEVKQPQKCFPAENRVIHTPLIFVCTSVLSHHYEEFLVNEERKASGKVCESAEKTTDHLV